MSRNFTLTLLLGILFIITTPTVSAQTFTPPVINNLDGEVVNFQPYDGVRLDNGDAQVVAGGWHNLSRARLRVFFTQGHVSAEDRVWVLPLNQPGGALTISGRNLYYQGAYIGNVKSYDWQPELIVQFTQSADVNAISAVIRSLEYVNTNPGNPTVQTRKITVTLNDGIGNVSTPSIITLNVLGGNKPPIGVDKFYTTAFGATLNVPVAQGLLSTERDPEGGALTATIIQGALHGNFTLYPNTSQFSYTPNNGFIGHDSITYNVCDASGACITLKAILSVGSSNVTPNAVDDRYYIGMNQVLYINKSRSILLNDSDPNSGSNRTFNAATLQSNTPNGTLSLETDGSFRYVPNAGFVGTDQFEYNYCDRQGECDRAIVRIEVGGNTRPQAIRDWSIFTGPIVTSNVLTNDIDEDGNNMFTSLVTAPVNGTVVMNSDGSFTYTANTGYFGTDSLIYQVCDNGFPFLCDTAILLLTRFGNFPPVITVPGTQTVPINTSLTFSNNISIADANAGTDIMKASLSVMSGTITIPVKTGLTFTSGTGTAEPAFEFTGTLTNISNALKTVVYTPVNNFNDIDSLRLIINDQYTDDPQMDSAKVAILVGPQEPMVTGVTSISSDGRYALGDFISIRVNFNKPIVVTGTPQLLLETGTTDRYATYQSGTGTFMNFGYTVQAGDISPDLDYVSTTALELAGGTIRNTANTLNAVLTLPAPGTPASLGGSKALSVDGIRPTITSIDWPADSLYKAGDQLIFTLHTSEDVEADAAKLSIKIGGTTIQLEQASHTATSFTYNYTILNTELDADGIEVTALTGVATDLFGNLIEPLTPLSKPGVLVDAIPPVVTSGQVYSIPENTTAGTIVGVLNAIDPGAVKALQNWQLTSPLFQLDPALGVLTVVGPLTLPYYDITVTVTDGVNTSAPVTVRINVTDATPPSITAMDYPADNLYKAGDELIFTAHTSEGIMVTTSTLPVIIGTTTVQAILKASSARALTYAYIILNGELDANGIAAGTPTGSITDSTGNALLPFTPAPLPAVLVDAVPPVITANQVFNIAENAAAGTVIGNIAATDAGAVKPLQNWQLTSPLFKVDAATGAVSLTGTLNYEANASYDISVTVSDGVNTSTAQTVRINITDVNETPTMDAIANVTPCAGGTANQLTVTGITAGPETAQTVTLSISADRDIFSTLAINNAGIIQYALKADATGTATVTVTAQDSGGTANNGIDTYTRSFTASVGTGPAISITSNKGNRISKGDVAQLTATGAGTYVWDNGESTAIISVRPLQKTTYRVTGTAANGCVATGSFELDINEDYKLDATNIITPNGDGKNDKWVIRNIDAYPNNEVKVFDRSGRMIYQKKGYLNEWDGSANGKPLQDGTYYYMVDFGPNLPKFKGYITVIRDLN